MSGITNPAEEYFKDGAWGWDGTQWRKLNLVFGYGDRLIERQANLSASAGTNTLSFTTVPAGEVWVYTSITAVNSNTNPASIVVYLNAGGVPYVVMAWLSPGAGSYRQVSGQFVLKATDYLQVAFTACTEGDDLYAWAAGYKMRVT